jgi:hypothetical protein
MSALLFLASILASFGLLAAAVVIVLGNGGCPPCSPGSCSA